MSDQAPRQSNTSSKGIILKSTTFWLSLGVLLLNPIAWVLDYIFKHDLLNYIVKNHLDAIPGVTNLVTNIPLETIATSALTIIGLYVAGQKGKSITTNLGKPVGSGLTENDSDG